MRRDEEKSSGDEPLSTDPAGIGAPGHEKSAEPGAPAGADCQMVMDRVHAFLASELDEASCEAIRQHLMACEQCMDDVDAEQAIKQLVNRCCSGQRAPETLRLSIMSSITTWRRG